VGAGICLGLLFKVPYREFQDQQGAAVYWVVYNVQFALPKAGSPRTKRVECIIDSGATNCLFHADIARFLGLDLESGFRQMTNGIGGQEVTWLHEIMLYIPGGPVKITAGFKEGLPVAGLLGMKGFFDHFIVTFDSTLKECRLERIYLI
jgi:hypothetical protein